MSISRIVFIIAVLSAFLLAASLGIRTTVARSATIVAVNSSETCERCKSRQKKICNYAESACKHRAKAAYYYAIGRCGTSKIARPKRRRRITMAYRYALTTREVVTSQRPTNVLNVTSNKAQPQGFA